jgi:hypothetical protein
MEIVIIDRLPDLSTAILAFGSAARIPDATGSLVTLPQLGGHTVRERVQMPS